MFTRATRELLLPSIVSFLFPHGWKVGREVEKYSFVLYTALVLVLVAFLVSANFQHLHVLALVRPSFVFTSSSSTIIYVFVFDLVSFFFLSLSLSRGLFRAILTLDLVRTLLFLLSSNIPPAASPTLSSTWPQVPSGGFFFTFFCSS